MITPEDEKLVAEVRTWDNPSATLVRLVGMIDRLKADLAVMTHNAEVFYAGMGEAVAKERERCAMIAEGSGDGVHCCEDCPCSHWRRDTAAEIRARVQP